MTILFVVWAFGLLPAGLFFNWMESDIEFLPGEPCPSKEVWVMTIFWPVALPWIFIFIGLLACVIGFHKRFLQ